MSKLIQKKTIQHFKSFIDQYQLLDSSKDILISFSGGVDSVVLVDLLCSSGYSKRLELIHFNHLNRDSNIQDEKFVEDFCKNRALQFKIIKLKGIGQANFENRARLLRYEHLYKEAKDKHILLGHHIDDSFEWYLMQLFKSSSIRNSIGVPLVKNQIVRPLMCLTKKQIIQYARSKKLKFIYDPTNALVGHERNYVRNIIIPKIAQRYPSYLKNYVARAKKLAVENDVAFLKQKKFVLKKSKKFCEIYSFDLKGELDNLDELITSAVSTLSSKNRGSLRAQIKNIKIALKNNKLGPLTLVDGIKVYISFNHLYISKEAPTGGSSNKNLKLSLDQYKQYLTEQNTFFTLFPKVLNYRFSTIKRSYPFDTELKGRISAIDLLRQWSKAQNQNKVLNLAF